MARIAAAIRAHRIPGIQLISGTDADLPAIDIFPNQYRGYEIAIANPEYTSICPKTGLPDFGTITLRYEPDSSCIELKSLKLYFLAYRNLGIFHENAVNRILRDLVAACDPVDELLGRASFNRSIFL